MISRLCYLSNTALYKTARFAVNEKKTYVSVVTLSNDVNAKLTKLGLKRTINWNKYQSKAKMKTRNQHSVYLIDQNCLGENRIFALSFENHAFRTVNTKYFLPTIEIKDYNLMIDGWNFFDQPVKNDNIQSYLKDRNKSRRWWHNWLFARLFLLQNLP